MKINDEPSTTDVCGLVMTVDYSRGEGVWQATLRHPNLGSYASHGFTPSQAREKARRRVAEQMDSLMCGHAQRHAHEIN